MFKIISLIIISVIGKLILEDDFVTRKIRNRWILFGLIFGEILLLSFLVVGKISNEYAINVLLNSTSALAVGFLMWYAQIWPAGDAKFFALYAFLLPLEYYNNSYIPIFPSVVLLVNIFVPFLLFVFIKAFWLYFNDLIVEIKKNSLNFILIKLGGDIKKQFLGLPSLLSNPKYLLVNFLKITLKYLLYFFILRKSFLAEFDALKMFYYFLIFLVLNRILRYYYIKSEVEIEIEELKPGMNLSESVMDKIVTEKDFFISLGRFMAEGLSVEQVEKIKTLYFLNNDRKIGIVKSIPFSLWVILGVIITIFRANMFINF